jgi:hypothetical protein
MVTFVIFFQKKAISQFALVFFVTTMQKFTKKKTLVVIKWIYEVIIGWYFFNS